MRRCERREARDERGNANMRNAVYCRLARHRRRGFSLLEVILALSILTGAMAVLGELARQGMESTRMARDLSYAQMLCETRLAEITAGIATLEAVQEALCPESSDPTQPAWLYSVDLGTVDQDGLLAVVVTVTQDAPLEKRPAACTLVRWMVDPGVELSEAPAEEESSDDLMGLDLGSLK